jgi:hypothetical protein
VALPFPSCCGSTVRWAGSPFGDADADYATIAYIAVSGATLWVRRYNGPATAFYSSVYSLASGSPPRVSAATKTTESPSGSEVTMLSAVSPRGRSYRTPCR